MTEINKKMTKNKTYNIFNVSSVESSIINLYINTIPSKTRCFIWVKGMKNPFSAFLSDLTLNLEIKHPKKGGILKGIKARCIDFTPANKGPLESN